MLLCIALWYSSLLYSFLFLIGRTLLYQAVPSLSLPPIPFPPIISLSSLLIFSFLLFMYITPSILPSFLLSSPLPAPPLPVKTETNTDCVGGAERVASNDSARYTPDYPLLSSSSSSSSHFSLFSSLFFCSVLYFSPLFILIYLHSSISSIFLSSFQS